MNDLIETDPIADELVFYFWCRAKDITRVNGRIEINKIADWNVGGSDIWIATNRWSESGSGHEHVVYDSKRKAFRIYKVKNALNTKISFYMQNQLNKKAEARKKFFVGGAYANDFSIREIYKFLNKQVADKVLPAKYKPKIQMVRPKFCFNIKASSLRKLRDTIAVFRFSVDSSALHIIERRLSEEPYYNGSFDHLYIEFMKLFTIKTGVTFDESVDALFQSTMKKLKAGELDEE